MTTKAKLKNNSSTSAKTQTQSQDKTTNQTSTKSEATAKVTNKETGNTSQLQVPTFISVESTIGAVSLLAMKSQSHKYLFLSDYEWLIMPAISTKQFVLFRGQQNEPVAFISWACVSNQVEKRMTEITSKLQPADWKSGENIYIMDIISPFGPAKALLKQLYEKQFQGKSVYVLRPKADGKGVERKLLKEIL